MKRLEILGKGRLSDSHLNQILGGEKVNYGCATGSGTVNGIYHSADSNENVTDDNGVTYDRVVRHVTTDKSPYDPCNSPK